MDRQPYTPMQIVRLDVGAFVELVDDDGEFALALGDENALVMIPLPRTADAWLKSKGLALRIERLEQTIRLATVGYAPEHNAVNGPGVNGPIIRPSTAREFRA